VRKLRTRESAANAERGEVSLVAEPLEQLDCAGGLADQFGRAAQNRLGI
jgi:hypothetical protein